MSASLVRRTSVALSDRLSERDLEVLRSAREHRFLTARQIEALHFADHATPLAGARVCRRVLARLSEHRLLARLERRVGGVRAGSASYVYALGPTGSRLIDERPRRVSEPSPLFLAHTLAVAQTHVELVQAARAGDVDLVGVEVEPACWRRYVGAGGAPEAVKPDLYVVTGSGEYEDCWFVEIDCGTESPQALRRKCRAYEAYWRSGREQAAHGTFPLVVWSAPTKQRAARISQTITATRHLKRELFRVTAAAELVALVSGGTG
ncbi:MAG TPA: replication-relaxation family protein [Gaiellaceae bacterium]